MKKAVAFLLACLLLIGGTAMAAELTTEVGISGADLIIRVPGDWYVLTRKSDVTQGNLTDLGLDQQTWEQLYTAQDIYMDCMFSDFSGEFVLMMQQNASTKEIFDLNTCTEQMLKTIESVGDMDLEDLQDLDETGNLGAVDAMNTKFGERYQHPQALFLTMDGSFDQQGSSIHFTAYTTILNGKQYNLYYRSYMGEITQQQRDEMRAIVESIEFSQVLPVPSKAPSATSSAGKTESAISGVVDTAKDSGALRNLIVGVLIGLGVLVAVLVVVIVIAVSVSRKQARKKAEQQMPMNGQPPQGFGAYPPPAQPAAPVQQPPVHPSAPMQQPPVHPPVPEPPAAPVQQPDAPTAPAEPPAAPSHEDALDDRPEN